MIKFVYYSAVINNDYKELFDYFNRAASHTFATIRTVSSSSFRRLTLSAYDNFFCMSNEKDRCFHDSDDIDEQIKSHSSCWTQIEIGVIEKDESETPLPCDGKWDHTEIRGIKSFRTSIIVNVEASRSNKDISVTDRDYDLMKEFKKNLAECLMNSDYYVL